MSEIFDETQYVNEVGKKNPEQKVDYNPETGFIYDDGLNHWSPEAGVYISNEDGKLVSTKPRYIEK